MENSTDTMEARMRQLDWTSQVTLHDLEMTTRFVQQEISLALQKRNEDLAEQINSIIRETDPHIGIPFFDGLRKARNIIQQP